MSRQGRINKPFVYCFMTSKEIPLQPDMFSGDLKDTRTRKQKQKATQQDVPRPMELFSSRDVLQFGVNPKPLIPLSEHTELVLESVDPRTEEEKERDRRKAEAEANYTLFPDTGEIDDEKELFRAGLVSGLPFSLI